MEFLYKKSFLKKFEKYERKLQEQIDKAIDKLPEGDVSLLKGKRTPKLYRLRIRDVRVLFSMTEYEIILWDIDSRGDIYKGI